VFKITAIIAGVNLLTSIIMLPETTTRIPHAETASASGADVEKSSVFETEHTVQATRESLQETASLRQIWIERSFFWTLPDIKAESNFFVLFLQPFSLLTSPAVLLTSITFGVLIAFTVMISIIYSTVLSMPPMLWTPLKVGLLNLSSIIGLMIGMPTGGILADIFYRRSARRNDGMAIRESRLKALLPGAIITPVGLVLIGVVLQKHLSWVGLAFGWLMMNIGLTAVANVMLTYSVDCYPWRSAHIGVIVNVIKNLVGFGTSYGVVPWYMKVGPQHQFGTLAGIAAFFFLLNVPLSFYGNRWRNWSLKYIM
jgi:MFS family permease